MTIVVQKGHYFGANNHQDRAETDDKIPFFRKMIAHKDDGKPVLSGFWRTDSAITMMWYEYLCESLLYKIK